MDITYGTGYLGPTDQHIGPFTRWAAALDEAIAKLAHRPAADETSAAPARAGAAGHRRVVPGPLLLAYALAFAVGASIPWYTNWSESRAQQLEAQQEMSVRQAIQLLYSLDRH